MSFCMVVGGVWVCGGLDYSEWDGVCGVFDAVAWNCRLVCIQ